MCDGISRWHERVVLCTSWFVFLRAGQHIYNISDMVSAVSEAVAAPQHVKGGIHNVQSQQSILDVSKIEEGVQDIDLQTKAPGA